MSERQRKHHKPLYLKVMVFEVKNDIQIRERRLDFANSNQKDWLYDLVLWATLNGKSVEIINEKDDKEVDPIKELEKLRGYR
jgi:hypothetical protein